MIDKKTSSEIALAEGISQRHARRLLAAGDYRAVRDVPDNRPPYDPMPDLKELCEQSMVAFTNCRPLVRLALALSGAQDALGSDNAAAHVASARQAIAKLDVALTELTQAAYDLNAAFGLVKKG